MGPDGPCDVLGAPACYGDLGFLLADEIVTALVEGGDQAAFARLDDFYASMLGPDPDVDAARWAPDMAEDQS
jgi:hypothetical protein